MPTSLPVSSLAAGTSWLALLEPLTEPPRRHEDGEPSHTVPPDAYNAPATDHTALRAEAETLLSAARTEASELLEDAKVQAEALREAAWQEGYHSGQSEGRQAVEAELRTAWETRQTVLRAELDSIAEDIATARAALWERQESDMVALVLDIARQVIKTEVTQNPQAVQAVIANAIRRITDKDNVRVRVSVSEASQIKEAREDLMEIVDGLRHLEIVDDRRISPGGCVIETNAGTIDARIETQMAEVAKALGVSDDE